MQRIQGSTGWEPGGACLRYLGQTAATPPPMCPAAYRYAGHPKQVVTVDPCLVEAHMTAFQAKAGGTNQPVSVPFDGSIYSWSVSLGNPSRVDTHAHPKNGLFTVNEFAALSNKLGEPSKARLSILAEIPGTRPKRYKLIRQSPTELLEPYFGQTVQFGLEHPLPVVEGQEVAITIPTWAPLFTLTGSYRDTYRASRNPHVPDPSSPVCAKAGTILDGHGQQQVGSTRIYGCYYDHNRLLYTATLVATPAG
jgi:hypothetical protein